MSGLLDQGHNRLVYPQIRPHLPALPPHRDLHTRPRILTAADPLLTTCATPSTTSTGDQVAYLVPRTRKPELSHVHESRASLVTLRK